MVNTTLSSRRKFLHNLTLLAAGTAVVPAAGLFCTENATTHLEQQWNSFCGRSGGKPYQGDIGPADKALLQSSAGHTHKTGPAIYFREDNILAQPTWVYWGTDKTPADVIVTFYSNEAEKKKCCRINRFELEALNLFYLQTAEQTSLPVRGTALLPHSPGNSEKKLQIKAVVRKNRVHLSVIEPQSETGIKKILYYNTQNRIYAS